MTDTSSAPKESFYAKSMTESQQHEASAIASILHSEIHHSGSFIEKLTDYSHAFARNERFDATLAERMIREEYQSSYGKTLNQTRENLMAREESINAATESAVLDHAEHVLHFIQDGPTQPFYKAYDQAAVALAEQLAITQSGAKAMMKEAFAAKHGNDLYARGKAAEEAYHKPVRQAEISESKAQRAQNRTQSQTYG